MASISDSSIWRTLAPELTEEEAWAEIPPPPPIRRRRRARPINWWEDVSADDASDEEISRITDRLLPLASSLLPPRDENPPESS